MKTNIEFLQAIAQNSGDSKLINYFYENEILKMTIDLNGESIEEIEVFTKILRSNLPQSDEDILLTCYIEVIDLHENLNECNGYYIPATAFGKFMAEVKHGLHLAYGLKKSESRWAVCLKGYERLFCCIAE